MGCPLRTESCEIQLKHDLWCLLYERRGNTVLKITLIVIAAVGIALLTVMLWCVAKSSSRSQDEDDKEQMECLRKQSCPHDARE